MQKKIAVFPGSFDPITKGHESIVKRALPLFDSIIIAIGHNTAKKYMFSLSQRIEMLEKTFQNEPKIRVMQYNGLTIDFCKQHHASYILRGLRNSIDFNYERSIAQMNQSIDTSIESFFLMTEPSLMAISSSIVREIIKHKGEPSAFLPEALTNYAPLLNA